MPSTELSTLHAVDTQLSPQHSEVGTITTSTLQMGPKFMEAKTLPKAIKQASAAGLGCSRVRRVQSEGTSGALPTVLIPSLPQVPPPFHHLHLPNTEATQVRGQPPTSPSISLDPPRKKKHHGKPGARMPGSDANLPFPGHAASKGPQFTPYQKWESV